MKKKYFGIADAHGLESFLDWEHYHEGHLGFLLMRTSANRHRHALAYQVELDDTQAQAINRMMKNEKYILACRALHDFAFLQDGAIGVEPDMVASWDLIPNPKLDPYNGRFYDDEEGEAELVQSIQDAISSEEE